MHIMLATAALVAISCTGQNTPSGNVPYMTDSKDGHAYVDLGLRLDGKKILFATMNIGASSETDFGDFFAWGETDKRYSSIKGENIMGGYFEWDNCPFHTGMISIEGWSRYIPSSMEDYSTSFDFSDGLLSLNPEDDAAARLWGDGWRIPGRDEFELLLSSAVTRTYVNNYKGSGVAGLLVTGRGEYASASLFIPAAGNCWDAYSFAANIEGSYWSRDVFADQPCDAWFLLFDESRQLMSTVGRASGYSIRPVRIESL